MSELLMLFAFVVLVTLGGVGATRPELRPVLWTAGALVIVIALERGAYWNLFGRGHGFFTANRTTALLIFVMALIGPPYLAVRDPKWARYKRR